MKNHFATIQLLRFLAAMAVALFHIAPFYRQSGGSPYLATVMDYGWLGVHVFFVISGFVMFYAVQRAPSAWDFFRRRLIRIYPPLWAAVALYLAAFVWLGDPIDTEKVLRSLTLIDAAPTAGRQILFVSWSLSYELMFYAGLALLLVLPSNLRLAGVFCGVFAIGAHRWLQGPLPILSSLSIYSFLAGLGAAYLPVNRRPARFILGGAGLALWVWGLSTGAADRELDAVVAFGGGTAIVFAANKGWDLTGMARDAADFLGDISYAIYLTHPAILAVLWVTSWHWVIAGEAGPSLTLALYAAAVIALGAGFHLTVEKPLLRWLSPSRRRKSGPDQSMGGQIVDQRLYALGELGKRD